MTFSYLEDAVIKTTNKALGRSAIYTYLVNSTTTSIEGVFDNSFVDVNGITTRKPTFKIRLADLASYPVEGDTLTIGSIVYTVNDCEPDSYGGAILILEKN